ncbi:MAG: di-heme oxidoredictase family protein, partial [Burkholderiaceae bacterium]
PHPNYGDQLQVFGVNVGLKENLKPGEAELYIDWVPMPVTLPDGTVVELRKPSVRLEKPNFGPIDSTVMTSLRNTQVVFGAGYLEAVTEEDILALAKMQQTVGLNGRPNYVRDDVNNRTVIGRFGWKANQPHLRQQIAAAFINDMGVTSPVYDKQNCPPVQAECAKQNHTGKPELKPEMWDNITFWTMMLDAPVARDQDKPPVMRGRQLFAKANCASCHVPELKTGVLEQFPMLSNRRIQPYTDLLLHDMGPDLADGRPDFKATGSDWRTAPLWGIGMSKMVTGSTSFLHDGRARDLTEAILWHGGEAKASRDAFAKMSKQDRDDLLAFLNAL